MNSRKDVQKNLWDFAGAGESEKGYWMNDFSKDSELHFSYVPDNRKLSTIRILDNPF